MLERRRRRKIHEEAVRYAANGWPVAPLAVPRHGVCPCGGTCLEPHLVGEVVRDGYRAAEVWPEPGRTVGWKPATTRRLDEAELAAGALRHWTAADLPAAAVGGEGNHRNSPGLVLGQPDVRHTGAGPRTDGGGAEPRTGGGGGAEPGTGEGGGAVPGTGGGAGLGVGGAGVVEWVGSPGEVNPRAGGADVGGDAAPDAGGGAEPGTGEGGGARPGAGGGGGALRAGGGGGAVPGAGGGAGLGVGGAGVVEWVGPPGEVGPGAGGADGGGGAGAGAGGGAESRTGGGALPCTGGGAGLGVGGAGVVEWVGPPGEVNPGAGGADVDGGAEQAGDEGGAEAGVGGDSCVELGGDGEWGIALVSEWFDVMELPAAYGAVLNHRVKAGCPTAMAPVGRRWMFFVVQGSVPREQVEAVGGVLHSGPKGWVPAPGTWTEETGWIRWLVHPYLTEWRPYQRRDPIDLIFL